MNQRRKEDKKIKVEKKNQTIKEVITETKKEVKKKKRGKKGGKIKMLMS